MNKSILLFLAISVQALLAQAQTIQAYIEAHAGKAQQLMQEHAVPASIILGVAIHESAAGKSKLAQHLNNHFGFKGKNSNTVIKSAYRDFPTVDSSYNHFITFLKSRRHFNVLFDKYSQYDFKNWAYGMQRGGYARSTTWATKVIALIHKYQLYQYDNRPDDYSETEVESLPATIVKNTPRVYTVKTGDNLSIIAKKHQTTVKAIMNKNGLKSHLLQPGQKLKL